MSAGVLACPACQRLVYASELKEMAERARATAAVGNFDATRTLLQEMRMV